MGYQISNPDLTIAGLILDMHLRGPTGRPQIDKIAGCLRYELERREEIEEQASDATSTLKGFGRSRKS